MNRSYLSIVILIIFSVNAYSQAIVPENRLFFPQMIDDAGPYTGELPVINSGQDTLSVISLKANCGCTQAQIDKKIIVPGDTAMVKITFNPMGSLGEVNKKMVLTLAPNNQKLDFYVGGKVVMSEATISNNFPFSLELDPSSFTAKGKKRNKNDKQEVKGQFLFNKLASSLKAAPNHMIPILTYNHSNTPVAIVITEKPKYIKAEPLLATIDPDTPCTLLIETKSNIPSMASSDKIKGKIIDAKTKATLGLFTIDLTFTKD